MARLIWMGLAMRYVMKTTVTVSEFHLRTRVRTEALLTALCAVIMVSSLALVVLGHLLQVTHVRFKTST